jgi:hypothetical protein
VRARLLLALLDHFDVVCIRLDCLWHEANRMAHTNTSDTRQISGVTRAAISIHVTPVGRTCARLRV